MKNVDTCCCSPADTSEHHVDRGLWVTGLTARAAGTAGDWLTLCEECLLTMICFAASLLSILVGGANPFNTVVALMMIPYRSVTVSCGERAWR